jgi:signal peptidase I
MADDARTPGIQSLKDAVGLIGPESPWPLQVERRLGVPLFFAHRGSSMNPTLHESDLLEIVPYGGGAAQVGDVIAVAPPDADHLVVHRVVRVMPEGVCTRGDNSAGEDDWCLGPERVIGRVVAAWRGQRRRRISGGWTGRLWVYALRGRRILGRVASLLLRPVYHWLAHTGIVRRLVPASLRPRVVVFGADARARLRLLLGRRIVGEYVPGWRKWRFRRPFRLLVDEAALPRDLDRDGRRLRL